MDIFMTLSTLGNYQSVGEGAIFNGCCNQKTRRDGGSSDRSFQENGFGFRTYPGSQGPSSL